MVLELTRMRCPFRISRYGCGFEICLGWWLVYFGRNPHAGWFK